MNIYLVIFDTLDGHIGLCEVHARTAKEAIELTKKKYPESINHAAIKQ